jgi:hypothetical protein
MEILFQEFLESDHFLDYMDYYEMISNNKKYAPNRNETDPKIYSTIEYFLERSQMGSIRNIDMNKLRSIYITTVPIIVPKVIIKFEMIPSSFNEYDLSEKHTTQTNCSNADFYYDIFDSDDDDYTINNYKQYISIHGLIKSIEIQKKTLKEIVYDSYEEDNDDSDIHYLIDNELSDNEEFD